MLQKALPRKLTAIGSASLIGALSLTATKGVRAQAPCAEIDVPIRVAAGCPARTGEGHPGFGALVVSVGQLRIEIDALKTELEQFRKQPLQ